MRLPGLRRTLLSTVSLAVSLLTIDADAMEVVIRSPEPGTPVFGQVDVLVEVRSPEPVARVELEVDGRPAGVSTERPYRFEVDVGEGNASHFFEATAIDRYGNRSVAIRETPRLDIHEVVDLDLQQIYVTVTGRHQRRILDLRRQDFEVFDEGKRQEIVTFERGDIPFTAVLLIDASSSMRETRLAAARRGAGLFIDGMKEFDEASIVAFADRLLHASPFSADPSVLNEEMTLFEPGGGTAIHDYLFWALRRLEARHGRRVVVFLSHGQDVHSVLRMHQVREVARRSQALVYWIRLHPEGAPPSDSAPGEAGHVHELPSPATDPRFEIHAHARRQHRLRQSRTQREAVWVDSWRDLAANRKQAQLLRDTVEESGGRILEVVTPPEIEAAFAEVIAELRDQYAIGYYPSEDQDDGGWRKLRIELARSGLKARAGGGYLDL